MDARLEDGHGTAPPAAAQEDLPAAADVHPPREVAAERGRGGPGGAEGRRRPEAGERGDRRQGRARESRARAARSRDRTEAQRRDAIAERSVEQRATRPTKVTLNVAACHRPWIRRHSRGALGRTSA